MSHCILAIVERKETCFGFERENKVRLCGKWDAFKTRNINVDFLSIEDVIIDHILKLIDIFFQLQNVGIRLTLAF